MAIYFILVYLPSIFEDKNKQAAVVVWDVLPRPGPGTEKGPVSILTDIAFPTFTALAAHETQTNHMHGKPYHVMLLRQSILGIQISKTRGCSSNGK